MNAPVATVKRLQDQVKRLTQERDAETKRADGLQKALQRGVMGAMSGQ
jgi:hypothetical protein